MIRPKPWLRVLCVPYKHEGPLSIPGFFIVAFMVDDAV
jgi:hypothetical protein